MLSRVADSMFWMGRYIERAENIARFIDVNQSMTLCAADALAEQWLPLVHTTGDLPVFVERYGGGTRENVLRFLTFDNDYPNSILSCLRMVRENARCIRESISTEMCEEINKFFLLVRDADEKRTFDDPYPFFNQVKLCSHLIEGITDATLSRGESWHFVRLGRILECADKTSRILDVKYFILLPEVQDVGSPLDIVQWSALLQSASALEMYRKARGRIVPAEVADFLLLDREFPRSVRFCLSRAEHSLNAITGSPLGTFVNRAEQVLGRVRAEFDYTHIDDVIDVGLHEFIDRLQTRLNQVGQAIHDCFFATQASGKVPTYQFQVQ